MTDFFDSLDAARERAGFAGALGDGTEEYVAKAAPSVEGGQPEPRRAVAREVAQFNDLIPVGTPVLYWPALREGPGISSKTRSRAWLLGDHTPVVMVEDYSGGIALSHVCPVPPTEGRAQAGDA